MIDWGRLWGKFGSVVLVILGLIAGLVGRSFFVSDARPIETVSVAPATNQNARVEELSKQLAELEQRVGQQGRVLEAQVALADGGSDRKVEVDRESARMPDPETAKRELNSSFEKAYDQFAHEAKDSVWAETQRDKIASGIQERLAHNPNKIITTNVECRTTMCIATFTWPDLETAKREMMTADVPDESCSRRMLIPDDAAPSGEFSAKLIFECKR